MATKYKREHVVDGQTFKVEHFVGLVRTKVGELLVESWHDQGTAWGWITTVKDAEGNQLGLAEYAYRKKDAMLDHGYMIDKAVGINKYAATL